MRRSALFLFVAGSIALFSATCHAETFFAYLEGRQEVPAAATTATGYARVFVNTDNMTYTFTVVFNGLTSAQTLSHIHAPAAIGATAPVIINFGTVGGTSGTISGSGSITVGQLAEIRAHQGYVNVHSMNFPNGELRGQLGIKRPVDFDGDGKMDFSVLRFPSVASPGVANIQWWNLNSTTGAVAEGPFGDANRDFPVPGDYDGDGKDDLAVYRDGSATTGVQSYFYFIRSSDSTFQVVTFGTDGDQAICRDYDGDGATDVAIFRRGAAAGVQAVWWISKSTVPGSQFAIPFGTTGDTVAGTGDTPVPGDYDGDGKFDLAVYRFGGLVPNNTYIVARSSDGVITYEQFGNFQSDYIVPGDYDGDGKFDVAVARTGAGSAPMEWWIKASSTGAVTWSRFGISTDLPTQGDYDGDARTDISIYRRGATITSQSFFWYIGSFDNIAKARDWGLRPDFPIATFDAR